MDLKKTKLYQTIKNPSISAAELWSACNDYVESGKNLNLKDAVSKETFLHVLAGNGGVPCTAPGLASVYLLASSGVDIDARDCTGETCLHKAARVPDSFRVIVALMRCGADPLIRNNDGKMAEDIMTSEQPLDWKQSFHWLNKFYPGLRHTLSMQRDVSSERVEWLLQSWCRTRLPGEHGETIELAQVFKLTDSIRETIHKFTPTNEFVIAMLSGKTPQLTDEELTAIDVNTADHSQEGLGQGGVSGAPRPLLAALWEMRLESGVGTLVEKGADTAVLYTPTGDREHREPLFFHLITKEYRPPDPIVHTILISSNMAVRDPKGQTVLFKAIEYDYSELFLKALFKYGVDVAARDDRGHTARDYAEGAKKYRYLTIIDSYVIELAKTCNFDKLQSLVLAGYDHIHNITDTRGINMVNILKQNYIKGDKTQLLTLMEKIPSIQDHIQLMFRATDTGGTAELQRHVSRRFSSAQDRCGRTVLHKAVVNKKKEMIKFIVTHYPNIIDMQDSLGRTGLHYAYLVTEGPSLVNYLILNGARTDIKDWAGRLPEDYSAKKCGKDEYLRLQKAVNNFSIDIYLAETNFEKALDKAVRKGKFGEVEHLMLGLGEKGDVNRYANVLFQCVDTRRQRIAVYLISRGMRTDIYKQYENCSPNSSACSMYTCDHSLTSLYSRAKAMECCEVLDAINDNSRSKGTVVVDGRPIVSKPSTMDQLTLLGLV